MVIAFLGDARKILLTHNLVQGEEGCAGKLTPCLPWWQRPYVCFFFPGRNAYFATFTKSRQNCITALEGCQTIESHLLSYFTAQCVKCAVRILTYIDRCFTHIVGVPWNTWRGRSVDIKPGAAIDETLHLVQKYKKANTIKFQRKIQSLQIHFFVGNADVKQLQGLSPARSLPIHSQPGPH